MEVRYAGLLSFIVVLSFIVNGAAARPIAGSKTDISTLTTTDLKVDRTSEMKALVSENTSTIPDTETSTQVVTVSKQFVDSSLHLDEDAGVTREERLLASVDYADPGQNPNPRYSPPSGS